MKKKIEEKIFSALQILKKYKTNNILLNFALIMAFVDANVCCCMYIFHQPKTPKKIEELKIDEYNKHSS